LGHLQCELGKEAPEWENGLGIGGSFFGKFDPMQSWQSKRQMDISVL